MNSFTFYKNYYELIKYLKPNERIKLYDAIMKYIFEDEEPQLNGLLNGIWVNLKMPLNTSKNNSGRGGRPKKNEKKDETELKPIENRIKTEKETNNISTFIFLISNNNYKYIKKYNIIFNKIKEWLIYKEERKEKYKQTGLNNLLKQIENKIEEYGETRVIDLINECMANNWKEGRK